MTTNFQDFLAKRRKKPDDDSKYMEIALKAAEHAKANGENPFGAVLVFPGGYMVEHDTCFSDRDHTCHAEMNVMRKAAQTKLKRMDDCTLYTTVEPCPMCAHAAYLNGIKEIIFGAYDDKNGFLSSDKLLAVAEGLVVKGGVLSEQCVNMVPAPLREHIRGEKENA
jgi:tRNA(adenine34) deaminase